MKTFSDAVVVVAVVSAGVGSASGAAVTYTGPLAAPGTGFGNTLPLLVLHAQGSEFGGVAHSGGSDVLTGDATNQSQTQPVSALSALGINADNLTLVFNIAETGSDSGLTLQGFTVVFADDSGALLFEAVYSQTQVLEMISGGVGSAGHGYAISLTAAEGASFFADPTNRIGMFVGRNAPITGSDGGPDGFYLIPSPGPGALALLVMLRGVRRRRAG